LSRLLWRHSITKNNKVNKVIWILFEYFQYLRFKILKYYKIAILNHLLQFLMKKIQILFSLIVCSKFASHIMRCVMHVIGHALHAMGQYTCVVAVMWDVILLFSLEWQFSEIATWNVPMFCCNGWTSTS